MKRLLYKEWKLALHPTNIIFLFLSAMMLIPGYPYYVMFFYTSLGIFFVCLMGRETNDIEYSLLLPIEKKDVVLGRVLFCATLELLQVVCAVPFILLKNALGAEPNPVGMDANIALLGLSLVMMGVFNLVFFTRYYRAPDKVGTAFIWGSCAEFLFMIAAETSAHAVPFVRDVLDTPDPLNCLEKLCVLLGGAALFSLLTYTAVRRSARAFERIDF